jgi:hypothetical protein
VLSVTEFWGPQNHTLNENGDTFLEGKPAEAWCWKFTQSSPETANDFSCSSTPVMPVFCALFHVYFAYTTSNQTQSHIPCHFIFLFQIKLCLLISIKFNVSKVLPDVWPVFSDTLWIHMYSGTKTFQSREQRQSGSSVCVKTLL